MHRPMMIFATMLLLAPASFGQEPVQKAETPKGRPVPGTGRDAMIGEEAVIYGPGAAGGANRFDLEDLLKTRLANDRTGLDALVSDGRIFHLDSGTRFLVISKRLEVEIPRPSSSISAGSFASSVGSAGMARPPGLETLEVRVLDGLAKGKVLHVPVDAAARLFYAPPSTAKGKAKAKEKPAPGPKARPVPAAPLPPAESEARASKALAAARSLEAAGKDDRALAAYRALILDDPASPSAAKATARVDALTGRPAKK